MAPEQLEGQEADERTDIFAFGAVLYEMASGRRAFDGKSQASVIAAILAADPLPLTKVSPVTPPALDRLVRTCLAKDPQDRWSSAHDVALQLRAIAEAPDAPDSQARAAARLARACRMDCGGSRDNRRARTGAARRQPVTQPSLDVVSILPLESTTLAPGEAPKSLPMDAAWRSSRVTCRDATCSTSGSSIRRPRPRSREPRPHRSPSGRPTAAASVSSQRASQDGWHRGRRAADHRPSDGAPRRHMERRRHDRLRARAAVLPHRIPATGGQPVALPVAGAGFRWFPSFLPDGRRYLFLVADTRRGQPLTFGLHLGSVDSGESRPLAPPWRARPTSNRDTSFFGENRPSWRSRLISKRAYDRIAGHMPITWGSTPSPIRDSSRRRPRVGSRSWTPEQPPSSPGSTEPAGRSGPSVRPATTTRIAWRMTRIWSTTLRIPQPGPSMSC